MLVTRTATKKKECVVKERSTGVSEERKGKERSKGNWERVVLLQRGWGVPLQGLRPGLTRLFTPEPSELQG